MAKRFPNDEELEALANATDSSEPISEEENHTSDENEYITSESDNDSSENNLQATNNLAFIQSKDKNIHWMLEPFPHHGRINRSNIIKHTPGPTRYATSRINNIVSAFQLFLDHTLENIILKMTNIEGRRVYSDNWENLDSTTLQAYVGLLLLAGVYKSYGESTKSLWHAETGRPIFRATMPLKRFCCISRVLRFDDKRNRRERRAVDKLAPIREFWEKWIEILPKLYNAGDNVTVDEQLVGFRGRCPFKQYIPSKPTKYGIKVWTVCDSSSSYVLKAQVYTGKAPGAEREKNQGMRVVLDLTHGLRGQNVTCDNFFTSYQLGQMLLKRNLTMLGTVRKNKPELPLMTTKNELHRSYFFFTKDTTVVSYVPKKNRNVILMSTLHNSKEVSDREDKKPLIILDYNRTKGAVDTLDQVTATYTCKRKSNRWPMILFYNIIDISAYNAFVLWREINPDWNKNILFKRRIFIQELGNQLIQPYISSRKHLPRNQQASEIVKNIQQTSIEDPSQFLPSSSKTGQKRARCKFCPSRCDNKTNMMCAKCNKHLCKTHVTYYCPNCKK